jgi:glutamate synthase (NADPH/NADH) large chain/glutamate synthase (ferredoxin)
MVTLEKVLSTSEQEAAMDRAVWHRGQSDESQLKKLLEDHNRWTGSKRARELLDHWAEARQKFVKVFPIEYKRALSELGKRNGAPALAKSASVAIKKEATSA